MSVVVFWRDKTEDESLYGVLYRIASGLSREQYGISSYSGGKAMFIDTALQGKPGVQGWYGIGIDADESKKFGKTFQQAMFEKTGYADVGKSFLFQVNKVPTNAVLAPVISLFHWGSFQHHYDTYLHAIEVGWDCLLTYRLIDGDGGKAGDLRLTLWGSDSGVKMSDYLIGNLRVGDLHRVAMRLTYTENPNQYMTFKSWLLDDLEVAGLVPITVIGRPKSFPVYGTFPPHSLYYHMGAGVPATVPAVPTFIGTVYSGFQVGDILCWSGAPYYNYPWRYPSFVQPAFPWWLLVLGLGGGVGVAYAIKRGQKPSVVTPLAKKPSPMERIKKV